MKDRLTPAALRWAQSRVASPVIIEADTRSITDLFHELIPYTEELAERFPRLLQPTIEPFVSPMRVLQRFGMITSYLPREVIFSLAERKGITKIYPDRPTYALYGSVPKEGVFVAPSRLTKEVTFTTTSWTRSLMGADVANQKGFTGNEVLVSINDTGASRTHEQIRRVQFETAMGQMRDENGHGTWCTSCVGGVEQLDEHMSRSTGVPVYCEGMAPDCDLLAIKCLGFLIGMGSTSGILRSLEMSLEYEADVISMSLGGNTEEGKAEDDPHYSAMTKVVEAGAIPVVASGNSGPEEGTVNSPGCLPQVLTVGAYDPISGKLADFSSRGPSPWGTTKPDVIAPGVNINSGIVGVLDTSGDGRPSRYSPISGTSMATPHVAGLIACMVECHRTKVGKDLSVEEIKAMMKALGTEKNNKSGWGPITWKLYERWISTQYGVKM